MSGEATLVKTFASPPFILLAWSLQIEFSVSGLSVLVALVSENQSQTHVTLEQMALLAGFKRVVCLVKAYFCIIDNYNVCCNYCICSQSQLFNCTQHFFFLSFLNFHLI